MIVLFGSSSKKAEGRHHVVVSSWQPRQFPPARPARGRTPKTRKPPQSPSGKPGAATRPGLQAKGNPEPHTPLGSPLLCLLSHPSSFVLPTSFFQFLVVTEVRCFRALPRWCQHQIVTTAQNAALVVTQTRIPSALPRWCQHLSSRCRVVECNLASTTNHHACRHTNPHSIGISAVVGHTIPRNLREMTKRTAGNGNKHPTGTSHRPCR
jgi:hypothetical protein